MRAALCAALGLAVATHAGCGAPAAEPPLTIGSIEQPSLIGFRDAVNCAVAAQGHSASDYFGYGCYCGKGGSGTPVDGLDACCKQHDDGYDEAAKHGCSCYTNSYSVYCSPRGLPICLTDPNAQDGTAAYCAALCCRIDTRAASCFANQTIHPACQHFNGIGQGSDSPVCGAASGAEYMCGVGALGAVTCRKPQLCIENPPNVFHCECPAGYTTSTDRSQPACQHAMCGNGYTDADVLDPCNADGRTNHGCFKGACFTTSPGMTTKAAVLDVCNHGWAPFGFDNCTNYTSSCDTICGGPGKGLCTSGGCGGALLPIVNNGGCGYPGYMDHPAYGAICLCK